MRRMLRPGMDVRPVTQPRAIVSELHACDGSLVPMHQREMLRIASTFCSSRVTRRAVDESNL